MTARTSTLTTPLATRPTRNLGISAHVDAGKTTLAERILFYTGRIHAMGDVRTERPPTLDHDPQEQQRGITIRAAATTVTWGDATLNLVDTPGHLDFTVEVERSLQAMDGAILVVCAVGGVQAQTRTVERQMARYEVPRVAFVNKCDRDGADPVRVVGDLRAQLGMNAVPVQLPLVDGGAVSVVDLVEPAVLSFDGETGSIVRRDPVPDALRAEVDRARERMLDAVSLVDDELAAVLLDGDASADQVRAALRRAVLRRALVPVLFGAAYRNVGVQPLLDAVVAYLPGPTDRVRRATDADGADVTLVADPAAPAAALAFKLDDTEHGQLTWLRVLRGTIEPGARLVDGATGEGHRVRRLVQLHAGKTLPVDVAVAGDIVAAIGPTPGSGATLCDPAHRVVHGALFVPEPMVERSVTLVDGAIERLATLLARQVREDPTLRTRTDPESGELLLRGMGELHLEVVARRFEDAGVRVALGRPVVTGRVALGRAVPFETTLDKQTGGPGMWARIAGRVEPADRFTFDWEVHGGAISAEYKKAIEAGFRDGLANGADVPVVGARVTVTDGKMHSNDSSDQAFYLCARDAFKEVLAKSQPVRLEPVMRVEVTAPVQHHGAVLSTLLSRMGRIVDAEVGTVTGRVVGDVPLAQMFGYANTLRSVTSGTGDYAMDFLGYEPAR